ncbi:TPA_asm: hypothetical protein [ssRNA phage Gerhypos.2_19]|uniref:Uncharacterized protein n=2 Tax=Fiersviridae TaxID=2842319 RepID=A0A8S5L3J7_9VIRU|nr:hypothetical protein QIL19_gp1 [ssRNA phage Gerhypos.2_19]QDH90027.1 MAG: hypothetical protein H2Bulk35283_000004 [Leviviridae sp.]DAD52075.1 TPA_asm: hypothetical protein [ssRNA phage Gerhypos.2_19]
MSLLISLKFILKMFVHFRKRVAQPFLSWKAERVRLARLDQVSLIWKQLPYSFEVDWYVSCADLFKDEEPGVHSLRFQPFDPERTT